ISLSVRTALAASTATLSTTKITPVGHRNPQIFHRPMIILNARDQFGEIFVGIDREGVNYALESGALPPRSEALPRRRSTPTIPKNVEGGSFLDCLSSRSFDLDLIHPCDHDGKVNLDKSQ